MHAVSATAVRSWGSANSVPISSRPTGLWRPPGPDCPFQQLKRADQHESRDASRRHAQRAARWADSLTATICVRELREAVVAAVPQQNRAADCAQIDVPFPDPGDVVPASATGALPESLARRFSERRGMSLVIQQVTVAGGQQILEGRYHPWATATRQIRL